MESFFGIALSMGSLAFALVILHYVGIARARIERWIESKRGA